MNTWFRYFAAWSLAFVIGLTGANADGARKVYFFGNSLINHPTKKELTNVPFWLDQIAQADGRALATNGQWGFLRQFTLDHPWERSWGFPGVPSVMAEGDSDIATSGFEAIVFNPTNFLQHQAPDAPYEFDTHIGGTPLSATLELLSGLQARGSNAPVFLYEGWADMGAFLRNFPPGNREMRRYHRFNRGDYHDWYKDYAGLLSEAGYPVTLIPVAQVLSGLLQDTALKDLPAQALYLDDAPHGTANLYLLAAMISYGPLFQREVPKKLDLPEEIDPLIRAHLRDIVDYISQAVPVAVKPEKASLERDVKSGDRMPLQPAGLKSPALAMGLNGLADWSTQNPFIDVMKSARPWIGHRPGQWGGFETDEVAASGVLDKFGWPMKIPDGAERLEAFVLTDQHPEDYRLKGRYRVRYEGEGELTILGRAQNVTYSPGEIWFDYTPGEGLVGVSIGQTDPKRNGNYIRNISIIRDDLIALHEIGAVFNPDWIAKIEDLKVLRFMDWQFTNNSSVSSWSERARLGDYSYVYRGAPLDIMLRLANEVGADPWFNMPHMADDDFVEMFAAKVKKGLDPNRVVYVEYSNEVWNFAISQAHWAAQKAAILWGESDDGWMRFAGKRAAEVADIWHKEFGETGSNRLRRVIATHTDWPGLEAALFAEIDDPAETFDAYAITGYFGHSLGMDEMAPRVLEWIEESAVLAHKMADQEGLSEAERDAFFAEHKYDVALSRMVAHLRQQDLAKLSQATFPAHAKVANTFGLELIMYEGGTHVVGLGPWTANETLTAFFNFANYAPEMASLYDTMLHGFSRAGGTMANVFVDVSAPSQWGSWGTWRHLGDVNPRAKRLMQWNESGGGPGDYRHGVTEHGGSGDDVMTGTTLGDYLIGLAGNDVFVVAGPDHIHGGSGYDRAIFPGKKSDYQITTKDSLTFAIGPRDRVVLREVEEIVFAEMPDQPMTLSALQN